MIEDTTTGNVVGSNSFDFFFLDPTTGQVFLKQSLTNAPLNQYSVSYPSLVLLLKVCCIHIQAFNYFVLSIKFPYSISFELRNK